MLYGLNAGACKEKYFFRKHFYEGLKQQRKMLKLELEQLPKKQRKEVTKHRKLELEYHQNAAVSVRAFFGMKNKQ